MSEPFFCTSLPRSRSCWLSNLLTTDDSLCYHDKSYDPVKVYGKFKQIGFCGPELITQFDEIYRAHPYAPWLLIIRKPDEALASFKHFAGDLLPQDDLLDVFWKKRCAEIDGLQQSKANLLTMSWDSFDNVFDMQLIWKHLLPTVAFDEERWRLLCDMNIQQDLKKGLKRWPSLQ